MFQGHGQGQKKRSATRPLPTSQTRGESAKQCNAREAIPNKHHEGFARSQMGTGTKSWKQWSNVLNPWFKTSKTCIALVVGVLSQRYDVVPDSHDTEEDDGGAGLQIRGPHEAHDRFNS